MVTEYTNNDVYVFLAKECRLNKMLWEKYGEGIVDRTTDAVFWECLNEELDCFRVCEQCGKPMIEGYLVDGCDTYCSDECLHQHLSDDEFNELFDEGNGNTYWTTWYEDSITFTNNL